MLRGKAPKEWRRGFTLCRRRLRTDSYGETAAYYDYAHPDLAVADGAEEGLCFQSVQAWQSSGKTSGGVSRLRSGEQPGGAMQAVLRSASLEVEPYDRLLLGGRCYEIKGIQEWPSHRLLLMDRLW